MRSRNDPPEDDAPAASRTSPVAWVAMVLAVLSLVATLVLMVNVNKAQKRFENRVASLKSQVAGQLDSATVTLRQREKLRAVRDSIRFAGLDSSAQAVREYVEDNDKKIDELDTELHVRLGIKK